MKRPVALFLVALTAIAAAPAPGSPEDVIVNSLKVLRDGKIDTFISTYCDANYCNSNNIESLKAYTLKHASEHAKDCLKADDTISITRTTEESDTRVKIFIQCEADRMPVPTTLVKDASGQWRINSVSW